MDWYDPTDDAQWVQEHQAGTAPSPFKPGDPPPFLDIPGLGDPESMQLDYCHAFHLGYGIDAASSTVVLLAKLGHFGHGALDDRLHRGYATFIAWCRSNKKQHRSKTSANKILTWLRNFLSAYDLSFSFGSACRQLFCRILVGFQDCLFMLPRNNCFPISLERPMTLPWFWRGWLLKCSKHRILSECGNFKPQHPLKLTSTAYSLSLIGY